MANSLCKWQFSKHQRKDIMRDVKRSSRFFFSDALGENGITRARMHQYARTLARKLDLERI